VEVKQKPILIVQAHCNSASEFGEWPVEEMFAYELEAPWDGGMRLAVST